ncbi:hypothetical protein [Pseudomonas vancouverensis]|uniref:Uncharacterized protein n=1 Tax=Pseudomonas vancouverensis TaxID=95300 RepID=A0A1H2MVN5_PSEVA|nr:hypothetical protein [Pseudomonas vancouverensis]KAB0489663.1 hypothetical protein F7R09_28500 [Pseudomonas vancouverensis]TDB67159.1 hypothetical protein EIY72_03670 [Pseudomonas vancouverensis]SDU97289.1 hypothetical protein SAMN05216558_1342 [Pseudomonas vancouverensis]
MNPTIQLSRAILDGLRQRATLATAEFYQKAGITAAVASPRFTVVPHGNNLFGVVDRQTGTERAEIAGHLNACRSAEDFESAARATKTTQRTVAYVARLMTRWAFVSAVMLAGFAFMGVSR